jgi:NAD(P)-dependent dehydrogenase (short-subunit alcohol dehydrogenase family)
MKQEVGRRKDKSVTTEFEGRTAVITGAAAGIGAALTECAAARGMKVVMVDIDAQALRSASRRLAAQGAETVAEVVDVSDFAQVEALAERCFDRFGDIGLLINNAGIEATGALWQMPVDIWDKMIGVNLNAVFWGMRAFIPRMLKAAVPAHVVNVASVAALHTPAFNTPYAVAKHGVLVLNECVAKELAEVTDRLYLTVVLPGPVDTGIFESVFSTDADGPGSATRERIGGLLRTAGMTPSDAAEAILVGVAHRAPMVHLHPDRSRGLIEERYGVLLASCGPVLAADSRCAQ